METLTHFINADSLPLLFFITATFLVAGLVKGVVGLGLPTVAVGLLGLVMAPAAAASLLIVPSAATNVWQLMAGPSFRPLLRRLWPMMIGICTGTLVGSAVLPRDVTGYATTALGMALVLYAVFGLAKVRVAVPASLETWLSPVVGAATGLVTSATGVFVMPAVPYLQGLGLDKDDLVQALGLAFTISTFALAASLTFEGTFKPAVVLMSFYALIPALVGMLLGQWIRLRIRTEVFRKIFFVGVLVLGMQLSLRSFMP
ncbi:MAG TPA: sulfite exporter TauE/SafE family protein [Noviherbaspirillum sp.]|uniref:sulfite exporter TauE/SafE family protein n=1 Tax=Noviherbaspirillum sp. TaxID=1926288 RepID=UPI002DDD2D6B|nr:sulfite exporter TauE/SafE family protein [Noviherbaspirillum sp.]HEV2608801.1 sulfite exporter TauE/SafE family protein [Noviherbaspirillum sp.]